MKQMKRIVERVCPVCGEVVYKAKLAKGESAAWVNHFADNAMRYHNIKYHSEVTANGNG